MAVGLNLDDLLIEYSQTYKKHYILYTSRSLYEEGKAPDEDTIMLLIEAAKSCVSDENVIDSLALKLSWRDNGFIAINMYSAADMNLFQDKIQNNFNYAVYNDGHVVITNRLDK